MAAAIMTIIGVRAIIVPAIMAAGMTATTIPAAAIMCTIAAAIANVGAKASAAIGKDAGRPAAMTGGAATGTMAHRVRAGGRSEEHTSELQSLMRISYAVFCLKKKNMRLK